MPLFDWLGYKRKLITVRADLAHIDEVMTELATVKRAKGQVSDDLQKIARAVAGVAHILVNVLDALPGPSIAPKPPNG